MPVIFGCTIILIALIRYEIRKHPGSSKDRINDFLKKELEANTTRKKDISDLPYVTVNLDFLPDLSQIPDADNEIAAIVSDLKKFEGKQLLNLSGMSNTELKLTYGAPNFDFLAACDANYTAFTGKLQKLGAYLSQNDAVAEAITVLEYAIRLDTDIAATYALLSELYRKSGNPAALELLNQKIEKLPDDLRTRVLHYIL